MIEGNQETASPRSVRGLVWASIGVVGIMSRILRATAKTPPIFRQRNALRGGVKPGLHGGGLTERDGLSCGRANGPKARP